MSAPNAGRQSPDPENQTGAQQQAHPAQPGSGKVDNSQGKNEGKGEQASGLADNPTHVLAEHADKTTSKS
ncbi:uncharacterized protein A1O9_04621 [Exophiala aquamarina CBS 119918]|uniref:Uncharacterized protein n=1 Tax=Exophiala aquamarina CBS 119918 TaxID=1182545 RepID=A0A072PKF5_9EURO|nr:uncharacterized protein A1O9_04621 [Exophiala aquamarina CBS 119918]KEF59773.1 hypothetical protein A1O9_04621 [Exophiala aquamarina CBS 119918]